MEGTINFFLKRLLGHERFTKSNNRGIKQANYVNVDNRKTLKKCKAIKSFVSNSVENTSQQKFLQECF